jgi:hypothetical protein
MRVHLSGQFVDFVVPLGTHILGRGKDCTLRIDDPRLSRQHAQFHHQGSSVVIEDMGSTNGVLINGERINSPQILANGQTIICGPFIFSVLLDPTQKSSKSEILPQTDRMIDPNDTEAMDPLEMPKVSSAPPATKSRSINPLIAAAVSSSGTDLRSDVSSDVLKPSEESKSGTGALATKKAQAVPPSAQGASANPQSEAARKRRNDQTSSLMPSTFTPHAGSALQPDFPLGERLGHAPIGKRCISGLLDVLTTLILVGVLTLPVLIGGYVWALTQAGVTMDLGLPRLTTTPPALTPTGEIITSLGRPGGIERAFYLIESLARAQDQQPFLTVFVTGTISLLMAVVISLIALIGATVVRGAPYWHHAMGLVIVENSTGYRLTWTRSLIRWVLFALLWPLAPVTLANNVRSLHDVLSGCVVRQKL